MIIFIKDKQEAQNFLLKLLSLKKVNPTENLFLDFEVKLRRVNLFSKKFKFKIYYQRQSNRRRRTPSALPRFDPISAGSANLGL